MDNNISANQGVLRPGVARSDAAASGSASAASAATAGDDVAASARAPTQSVTPPAEVQPPQGAPQFDPGENIAELLEGLSQRLNEFVQQNARELEFRVNDEGGRVVILVKQSETGEVLRSIPPEEAQGLVDNLDSGVSALFSQRA